MSHVKWSDMAPGLRAEGWLLQKLSPFRNEPILKAAGLGSVFFFKALPTKLLGGEKVKIPAMNGGQKVNATVYRGKGYKTGEGPCYGVLWMHGGGYAMGGPNMIAMTIAWKILNRYNCVLLAPDYAVSPLAPYPKALEQCWSALQWFGEHASEYGVTEKKLIVGGESAGGGLSTALTLYARDHGFDDIGLHVAMYPMLDCLPTETNQDNDAPNWNSVANDLAWKLYLGHEPTENEDKYASPARETDWTNLPPTVTLAGTIEPFYAETKTYVANLRAAGVGVAFREFPGGFHAFDMMQPFAKISKEAVAFVFASMDTMLKG